MAASIGKVSLEAKLTIKVGEQQVELAELASALTRAGVELQALVDPSGRTVESITYSGVRTNAHVCPTDDLRMGDGIYRDRNGKLRSIELHELSMAANEIPRVEGHITGRI